MSLFDRLFENSNLNTYSPTDVHQVHQAIRQAQFGKEKNKAYNNLVVLAKDKLKKSGK